MTGKVPPPINFDTSSSISSRLSSKIVNYLKDFAHQEYVPHLLETGTLVLTSQDNAKKAVDFLTDFHCSPSSTKLSVAWKDVVVTLRRPGWLGRLATFLNLSGEQIKGWLRRFRSLLLKALLRQEGIHHLSKRPFVSCLAYRECKSSDESSATLAVTTPVAMCQSKRRRLLMVSENVEIFSY